MGVVVVESLSCIRVYFAIAALNRYFAAKRGLSSVEVELLIKELFSRLKLYFKIDFEKIINENTEYYKIVCYDETPGNYSTILVKYDEKTSMLKQILN